MYRRAAIAVALLGLGFLLGSIWSPVRPTHTRGGADVRGPDFELRRHEVTPAGSRAETGEPAEVPAKAKDTPQPEPLTPDAGNARAAVEFDFGGLPGSVSRFACLACIEGTGLDGARARSVAKPYGRDIVRFDVPAGRWRVKWQTSFKLADEHGRILRLKPDEVAHIDVAADPGDEVARWIWPGLGMVEVTVIGPVGRPLANAPVVLEGAALTAESARHLTATDSRGRCRFELRPGQFDIVVGWRRKRVSVNAGEVSGVRIDGRETGSLLVISDRPQASRIRLAGTEKWMRPNESSNIELVSDHAHYDLLPPGNYEITILRGPRDLTGAAVVGNVVVTAGAETRFHADAGR